MKDGKLSLNKPSKWFINNALKMHKMDLHIKLEELIETTPKLNYKSSREFGFISNFKEDQIVGKYGWIHPITLSEEERLVKSEEYQKIFLEGQDVSKSYKWYEGFNSLHGPDKDAIYQEPQVKVSKNLVGTLVKTWRLNLFIDDEPNLKDIDDYYLDYCFRREVVVITTDLEPKLLPCGYAWLFSPEWDSFCDKAWKDLRSHEPPHIGNHEIMRQWPDIQDSDKFSTLFL